MNTAIAMRFRLDEYVGTYSSTADKTKATTIWRDRDTLCMKEWGSTNKTYLIVHHPFECTGWPQGLFAVGRAIPDFNPDSFHKHRGEADAGHVISFCLSDDETPTISGFRWKMDASSPHALFTKNDISRLLALPDELKLIIVEYALFTNNELRGDIHLHEEADTFCFAETNTIPSGGETKRFRGDIFKLPMPMNNLARTCQKFRAISKGPEVQLNHIKVNSWTFDSLLRGKHTLVYSLEHIREVTLFGDFTLGDNPDQNLLHGLIDFAFKHPKAMIRVHVKALRPMGPNGHSIDGFMALGYCIREAIRGIPRPPWSQVRNDRLKNWLREKQPGRLNASNVRFFPNRADSCTDPDWHHPEMLRDLARRNMDKNVFVRGHGGIQRFIGFVEKWYKDGI